MGSFGKTLKFLNYLVIEITMFCSKITNRNKRNFKVKNETIWRISVCKNEWKGIVTLLKLSQWFLKNKKKPFE